MSVSMICLRRRLLRHGQQFYSSRLNEKVRQSTSFPYHHAYATSAENLPRVAQPSIWHSVIPKAFREPRHPDSASKSQRTKEWNPATFFIIIFLLIGSNAIQMLALRNEYSSFSRKADQKIALLKEVIDRVQRGENVNVEKVLGTGDAEQEQEWKDVIKNIEEGDHLWAAKDRRREKRRLMKEQNAAEQSPTETKTGPSTNANTPDSSSSSAQAKKAPSFY